MSTEKVLRKVRATIVDERGVIVRDEIVDEIEQTLPGVRSVRYEPGIGVKGGQTLHLSPIADENLDAVRAEVDARARRVSEPRLTWGRFKRDVEAAGVTDTTEVSYIDWEGDFYPSIHRGLTLGVRIINGLAIDDED